MAQDRWTDIGNTSVPFEPLPPDRLDVWFVRRPDSPLETLARQLAPDRLPQQYILVGQPTSG
jgi:hypothetical protein